jgi:predicted acyl esterase
MLRRRATLRALCLLVATAATVAPTTTSQAATANQPTTASQAATANQPTTGSQAATATAASGSQSATATAASGNQAATVTPTTASQAAIGSRGAADQTTTDQTRAAIHATTTGFRAVDIVADDGAVLKANVIEPTSAGRHPAIVFVNSWGLNDAEYLAQASAFAQAGYTVLSYTTRGFWGSGGQIDTAGPKDIADVSTVLDWLVANTAADPAHIGVAGVSYGAGIGLIASAFDPRIRAVAAMSGWTDLVESLYGNNTRRPQAAFLLAALARLTGHPSAELTTNLADYFADRDVDAVKAWGRVRSAATYLDAINANHPAILMANAYGDSLFAPNQLVDFFTRLTTPKRLELAAGDHAVVEATGLLGLDNHVWTSVRRWFDQYLSNVDTGIATEPPVVLRVREGGAVEQYADWVHVSRSTTRYGLQAVPPLTGTGALGTATSGWSQTIWTGLDTTADAGVALLSGGLEALDGIPPVDWLPSVSRVNGAVWQSGTLGSGAAVRGMPRLHLSLRNAPTAGTVVAYLYDVDWTGTGRLIDHAPVTWTAPVTGALDVALPATAYDVPAGHRLALVLDTQDPLYLGANALATPITVTGPSWLDIPLK